MALPQNTGGNGVNVSPQQLAELIGMLAKQPQANPTSSYFDPNYFASLTKLAQGGQSFGQTSQPASQTPVVSCGYNIVRIADDPDTIPPQEVSMGVVNLFPSSDGMRIFSKEWATDGSIKPRVYILQEEANVGVTDSSDSRISEMEARIEKLEAMVAKLKKQQSAKASAKPKAKPVTPKPATQEDSVDE